LFYNIENINQQNNEKKKIDYDFVWQLLEERKKEKQNQGKEKEKKTANNIKENYIKCQNIIEEYESNKDSEENEIINEYLETRKFLNFEKNKNMPLEICSNLHYNNGNSAHNVLQSNNKENYVPSSTSSKSIIKSEFSTNENIYERLYQDAKKKRIPISDQPKNNEFIFKVSNIPMELDSNLNIGSQLKVEERLLNLGKMNKDKIENMRLEKFNAEIKECKIKPKISEKSLILASKAKQYSSIYEKLNTQEMIRKNKNKEILEKKIKEDQKELTGKPNVKII